jgi:hypothetical protein
MGDAMGESQKRGEENLLIRMVGLIATWTLIWLGCFAKHADPLPKFFAWLSIAMILGLTCFWFFCWYPRPSGTGMVKVE